MNTESINIITLKSGDHYGADFVNRPHSAVTRNLQQPHKTIFRPVPQIANSSVFRSMNIGGKLCC